MTIDLERLEEVRRFLSTFGECPTTDDPAWLLAELDAARKKLADERAEYMLVESALVDAMGALQFYGAAYPSEVASDGGKRARVTNDRLFARLVAFARIQKLKG